MAKEFDIIGDIHADHARLNQLLAMRRSSVPVAFLGDFIDGKSTKNAGDRKVLEAVRHEIENRGAVAVMGNHELNAILFHTQVEGVPLRKHSQSNIVQHRTFIDEFGISSIEATHWVDWFLTLPLWLELEGLRLVHACWSQPSVDLIKKRRPNGILTRADLPEIAEKKSDFALAVQRLLSGPEVRPNEEFVGFRDRSGELRFEVRVCWWKSNAQSWRELAMSVPDLRELPSEQPGEIDGLDIYGQHELPVLFGHYQMKGDPLIQSHNATCLDYSESPCMYRWNGESLLNPNSLIYINQ